MRCHRRQMRPALARPPMVQGRSLAMRRPLRLRASSPSCPQGIVTPPPQTSPGDRQLCRKSRRSRTSWRSSQKTNSWVCYTGSSRSPGICRTARRVVSCQKSAARPPCSETSSLASRVRLRLKSTNMRLAERTSALLTRVTQKATGPSLLSARTSTWRRCVRRATPRLQRRRPRSSCLLARSAQREDSAPVGNFGEERPTLSN
mmetsp:Transcript_24627/g.68642  ORF Transcript_24627/g.68642 Transcript_24627/m.68642 type:complete len:203 (+) Transcript_24627:236-844(+)